MINNSKKCFLLLFCFINIVFCQTDLGMYNVPSNTGSRYVSGEDGVIRMYVNIWGHVKNPGRILVDDGIDLTTLLSLSGGPVRGAKLKKICIYHEYPTKDGKDFHIIDLTEFIKTGDRSNFIEIQPNDTIIINQTFWSYVVEEINTINTIMNLINIYLITNLF